MEPIAKLNKDDQRVALACCFISKVLLWTIMRKLDSRDQEITHAAWHQHKVNKSAFLLNRQRLRWNYRWWTRIFWFIVSLLCSATKLRTNVEMEKKEQIARCCRKAVNWDIITQYGTTTFMYVSLFCKSRLIWS